MDRTESKLRVIQANLRRSRNATAELHQAVHDRKISIALIQEPYVGNQGEMKQYPGSRVIQCTLNRQKPVKAAIVVYDKNLEVIHDPQLVTENIAAVYIKAGPLTLGVVSVYFEDKEEIEPYLTTTRQFCGKLRTNNIIVAGDVNAWSQWWGSVSENERGTAYHDFLNEMDLQILNTGDTPTFEEYRRGVLCTSIVDVTACSVSLLGKIVDWKVDRSVTTSDHNALTFALCLEKALEPLRSTSTRKYNTKKADWMRFKSIVQSRFAETPINASKIEEINRREDLESILTSYTNIIQEACDTAIPSVGSRGGKAVPPWWSNSLEHLKNDVLRKKRRIRNAAPHRRKQVLQEYISAKEEYSSIADDAMTSSWKEFCSTQDRESMWDGIYRVLRKTARRHEDMLLRGSTGETLTPEESAQLLAKTFYPDDSVDSEQQRHTALRRRTEGRTLEEITELSANDPPFTEAELEAVLKVLNPKKAPGLDGLTADICETAILCDREVFLAIANKCLSLTYFPRQWKAAHVCILRKPGKDDYTHPKSYRPIGLLPVLGKIVEKLLVTRLQWYLLPKLDTKQYGFMPQRSTEDALYDLVTHIRNEINNKKIVLIVSLDIEGAFDNAWWPALKNQLIAKGCPRNLYAMVVSYLQNRSIMVSYARATSSKETTKGCVQGSIGGPTFWNLILDALLQKLTSQGVYCQAYADDVVLVFSGHKVTTLQQTANTTLETVVEWGVDNKLSFAAHKTSAMVITKKLKYDNPEIYMAGTRLNLVEEIKLLGLIIDRKLTFNAHVTATCKKTADIYKQLACAAKVNWGLNKEIIRTIYVSVIEPIVLYAASAWSPSAEKIMVRNQLDSLQRGFAQKICKAYRTVSLTSALVLTGLLPLDLRIQEAALLFKIKKGYSEDLIPPGRDVERKVEPTLSPHPAQLITTEYERLEDLDPETLESHKITGPQIYTDGSKIEGKVGAALTWWDEGRETRYSTFRLEPHNTVFQSELYALFRAVKMARESKANSVSILSDSRSSLDLLSCPAVSHPLALQIKRLIKDTREEGREIRLFWLRAHVGTPGNERADELAKKAALTKKTAADYDKVPISFAKRRIREETVKRWQERYESSETGPVTKTFFPSVITARRILKNVSLTPRHVQVMTGHGGLSEYLHRFKLKNSPLCVCQQDCEETIWHVLFECPRFQTPRFDLEQRIDSNLSKTVVSNIMADDSARPHFLEYAEKVMRIVAEGNKSPELTPVVTALTTAVQPQAPETTTIAPHPVRDGVELLLQSGERGVPGIQTYPVALFMDDVREKLGLCFCSADGQGKVYISPGLAALMNGSTSKTSLKRAVYNALPELKVEELSCRLIRKNNKVIALFDNDVTSTRFAQASSLLAKFVISTADVSRTSRIVSVDVMRVGRESGEAADYIGCLQASDHHEVRVYEDRGENLSFLLPRPSTEPAPPSPENNPSVFRREEPSGSERLQQQWNEEADEGRSRSKAPSQMSAIKSMIASALSAATKSVPSLKRALVQGKQAATSSARLEQAVAKFTTSDPKRGPPAPKETRTRADKGQVIAPTLATASTPMDHMINAFREYESVLKANMVVIKDTCQDILRVYKQGNTALLKVKLEEAEATIYNNETATVIAGNPISRNMVAYTQTRGFVALDEKELQESGSIRFDAPEDDPIVVTTRDTKIMLDDRILDRAKALSFESWQMPRITWVNGVPGCGKTTWIINEVNPDEDLIVTTATEAARDVRERLAKTPKAAANVRTLASVLVNGVRIIGNREKACERLILDEALMNHFGAVVMAARMTGASQVLLIGDVNQLPYIDRQCLFRMRYHRPHLVANITKELLCTHRNPMDVPYAINQVYKGIYSSRPQTRSLTLKRYTDARIQETSPDTLYLVHTQAAKSSLIGQGYGKGEGSRVLTIHEAQGLTYPYVVIVRTTANKLSLYNSVPHAVVAVTRHTNTCVYYTDDSGDAIARLIRRAESATDTKIRDHNLKMAIQDRNRTIIERAKGASLTSGSAPGPSGQAS